MLYGVASIFFTWLPMYFHDTYRMNSGCGGDLPGPF